MDVARLRELLEYREGGVYWKVTRNQNTPAGSRAGTCTKRGYRVIWVDQKAYKEHHVVWALVHGVKPDYIDHINRVKGDNRIENLRLSNPQENPRNREYKLMTGITRLGDRWRVQVWQKHVGMFDCLGQAIKKRNEVCGI